MRSSLDCAGPGTLYGNCEVLHPTQAFVMFRCNPDKQRWYLERGLASVIQEDPPRIRLLFHPKGPGHHGRDPYFLQEFKNVCVACGSASDLTHHHVVPFSYRRHFPQEGATRGTWMYDVLLLCAGCHDSYEKHADALKKKIARECKIPEGGTSRLTKEEHRVIRHARTLERHWGLIPKEKRMGLEEPILKFLGKDVISREELGFWRPLLKLKAAVPPGKLVVDRTPDLEAFSRRWREHFIENLSPKFLPDGWVTDKKIYEVSE